MTTLTIILILLSTLAAAALSFLQYFYKVKVRTRLLWLLATLRFVAVFGLLLLLINPIISRKTFEVVKTPLPVVVDNSSSILDLSSGDKALSLYDQLSTNKQLKEKFDVQTYRFDADFELSERFDFGGKQTDIEKVGRNLKSIFRSTRFPTILISDGNQTVGNDYVYSFGDYNRVYPLILGDTTTYSDLRISEINVNKYAFRNNKFPVEVFLNYEGKGSVSSTFKISQGNNILHSETVNFSENRKSAVLNVLLPATKVGLQVFKATLASKGEERNTYNNTKNFAVEVLDQKTNVGVISEINHPDIGALKRAIESNAQRKVTILKPQEISDLSEFNVLILYQPSSNFRSVFERIKLSGINTFVITGVSTDYALLNQAQNDLIFNMSGQRENYTAGFDSGFNLFALDNLGFEQLPPLQNAFGTIKVNGKVEVLLKSRVQNIDTNTPLLAFTENMGRRAAYLFGENSWKWRMYSHIENKSYEKYDVFIDKIIQFLSSNNARKSLVVNHERFYNSGENIEITAQYFNKNYELDERAKLTIAVINKKTKQVKRYDLLRKGNAFKVNLDGLDAGSYDFTVKELNSNSSYSSAFEILDFDIEKQFVNPDVQKLNQLASQTGGKAFVPNQVDQLVSLLMNNPDYTPTEKAIVRKTPLIDWIWLLIIVVISLGCEWFIRKYHGLL